MLFPTRIVKNTNKATTEKPIKNFQVNRFNRHLDNLCRLICAPSKFGLKLRFGLIMMKGQNKAGAELRSRNPILAEEISWCQEVIVIFTIILTLVSLLFLEISTMISFLPSAPTSLFKILPLVLVVTKDLAFMFKLFILSLYQLVIKFGSSLLS